MPPARWCWIPTSRCAAWSGWSSACSSGWARWVPCWGFSRTTASSWECGCGRGPSAGSWPGAVPAAPEWRTCCATRPYAGIYAYGRSTLDPRRRQPGRPCTGRIRVGRDGWLVYLPGVLPAYISIEQYERNMARLDANRSRAQSMGAVRDGPALLAGLVACGRCGSKMTVRYQRGRAGKLHPVYVCSRAKSDYAASAVSTYLGRVVCGYQPGHAAGADPVDVGGHRTSAGFRPLVLMGACPLTRLLNNYALATT